MAVPEIMLGSFQMETSEGFDEFMYELGVNMFTRLVMGMSHWLWRPVQCTAVYLYFCFEWYIWMIQRGISQSKSTTHNFETIVSY